MTDDEMIEKTRAGWLRLGKHPATPAIYEAADRIEKLEAELDRCRKSNAVMDNTVRELEADKALLREALGSAIRNIENLTADMEAHKECAECQNNIEMYVEATGIYRAALQETSHMTHDEMIEATKQALADTTNFDGDRLASHFSDSELDDMARAAIRVIAPAVLEEAAIMMTPTNPKSDWTDYARNKARWADDIRAMKTRYEQ